MAKPDREDILHRVKKVVGVYIGRNASAIQPWNVLGGIYLKIYQPNIPELRASLEIEFQQSDPRFLLPPPAVDSSMQVDQVVDNILIIFQSLP